MDEASKQELLNNLVSKAYLKQDVYQNTLSTFELLKTSIKKIIDEFREKAKLQNPEYDIPFEFRKRGDFEIEMKFAGDILIFMMHTNVFEVPRHHFVMKSSYVKEDRSRAYCGIINIYNFLSDSFKHRRVNDSGYLIGRIFINKDMHYFIEGKKEIGLLYNNFVNSEMNKEIACDIVESAIKYTINFDLLTPPYEHVKLVSVHEFLTSLDSMSLKTGKRLGFQFKSDQKEIE
ncbi:MAG: hypothetical protein GY834_06700 [Bacteroidetes bacterium]|nr:hypothetical protein [Bacteroidota bacterium]